MDFKEAPGVQLSLVIGLMLKPSELKGTILFLNYLREHPRTARTKRSKIEIRPLVSLLRGCPKEEEGGNTHCFFGVWLRALLGFHFTKNGYWCITYGLRRLPTGK